MMSLHYTAAQALVTKQQKTPGLAMRPYIMAGPQSLHIYSLHPKVRDLDSFILL